MSTPLLLQPKQVKQLASPHSAKPPYLYGLAQRAERLAVLVEEDWDSFSDEMKHLLTCIAYDSLKPPRFSLKHLFLRLRWSWMVAFDDEDALLQYRASFARLRNAVLDAIESENEDYQADLVEALSSLRFDPDAGRRVRQKPIYWSTELKEL